jgi:peptide/histidine transporter 3/4
LIVAQPIILRDTPYFQTIRKNDENITTIIGSDTHIVGVGRATIILPNGTELVIQEALLYPESTRTLLSFKDIRANNFHLETNDDDGKECLIMTKSMETTRRLSKFFLPCAKHCTTHILSQLKNMLQCKRS